MSQRTLFFLLWWVSLVFSRSEDHTNDYGDVSNSGDHIIGFDDDQIVYKVDLGAFRLGIMPTTNILTCREFGTLLHHVEMNMKNYLKNAADVFVESIQISTNYKQKVRGKPIISIRAGCDRRRYLMQDYEENTNNGRELQQYTYTTELDMTRVTIFLTRDQNLSEKTLMYQLQKAVHLIDADSAISAGSDIIEKVILLWGEENYTLRPTASLSSIPSGSMRPSIRPSIRPSEEPTPVPIRAPIHSSSVPSEDPEPLTRDNGATVPAPEQTQTPDTSDELMYETLMGIFIGLGGVALFSGAFLVIRRSRTVNYETPVPAVFVPRNIQSNHSILSDENGETTEDIEQPNFTSSSSPHPYHSLSNFLYSTDIYSTNISRSSDAYPSTHNSEDSRSSSCGFESDKNWDPNDNEVDSYIDDNGEDSFSPSRLNGAALNALDSVQNHSDMFYDQP